MISAKDLPTPDDLYPIRRALLSVYDKTDIVAFAQRLQTHGVELISTGGTAQALRDADLPVTEAADLTGIPEVLDGRVKTLHPAIHAGLLARRTDPEDWESLEEHGFAPIDLVVCNLYPFTDVVADDDAGRAQAMENVDIGGPTMIRAAAKNHAFVGVVTTPDAYDTVADELDATEGSLSHATRQTLAHRAFEHTAAYDAAIRDHLSGLSASDAKGNSDSAPANGESASSAPGPANNASPLPNPYQETLHQVRTLRYGENPNQAAALYGSPDRFYESLHGKALSFNNLLDLSAALALIDEFRDAPPTCAILKHTNPCGVATADTLLDAWTRAFATDRKSPFGGIVVVNRALDHATAEAIDAIFTELVIAPAFEDGVLDVLKQKKNRRLIRHTAAARDDDRLDMRSVTGGLLVQERDPVFARGAIASRWEVVTDREPTDAEAADLDFAWRVVKHVKSNAIVYAKEQATVGIGAGQMSRVDASELAVRKAQDSELDLAGSVVASDAFFPFADGLEAAARHGARAVIQPGGSIRDDEVIGAADAHDVAMVCTGNRHFRH